MKLDIKVLHPKLGKEWKMPFYATSGSVGMDLVAAVNSYVVLWPGERKLIPSGFSMSLPPGYEVQIRPRSGLALKKGITVLNSPGTIDSDFRSEIGVILFNTSHAPGDVVTIQPGERIAQMVVNKVELIEWNLVDELDKTERKGGFGSTG